MTLIDKSCKRKALHSSAVNTGSAGSLRLCLSLGVTYNTSSIPFFCLKIGCVEHSCACQTRAIWLKPIEPANKKGAKGCWP